MIGRFDVKASNHGNVQQSRGHGSVTKEKAVQSVRPKIADGLPKVFIFVERRQ
jgi:hypothetical protein